MKNTFSVRVLAEIAIFAALAIVLDLFFGAIWKSVWINGGSVGLAMVPVIIICYRRGFLPGLLTGIIVALLNMLLGVYAISDEWYKVMWQILLDYVLAYPLVSVCGLFANLYHKAETTSKKCLWLAVGISIGGLLKFLSHFLSGVLFWPDSIWEGVPSGALYSLLYNGSFMLPTIILCIAVTILIDVKNPKILNVNLATSEVEANSVKVE